MRICSQHQSLGIDCYRETRGRALTGKTKQRLGIWAALLLISTCVAALVWVILDRQSHEAVIAKAATAIERPKATAPEGPQPPAALAAQIAALGKGFDGSTGIAVLSIDDGWMAGHKADRIFPQQSVSKMWVAAAMLDKVDSGEASLSDTITLTPADLTIFHQPVRKYILAQGRYTTTIGELMRYAIAQSDNTANDALYRRVGGQDGIGAFIMRKRLGQIAIGPGEKILQTEMAGLKWDPAFSYGRIFWQVRGRLPAQTRADALNRYLAEPADGATPEAIARALAMLHKGELLSPATSAFLIDLMNQSKTGPDRLRGALIEGDGWQMAHKTGTGQVLGSYATAYNDVGILTAPSGRSYAVVVMIGATQQSVKARQEMMHGVMRSVIALEGGA
jgi:beta-lactamase class A